MARCGIWRRSPRRRLRLEQAKNPRPPPPGRSESNRTLRTRTPLYATKSDRPRERILSSATSGAAATAFARLGAAPRERRTEGELTIGAADRTLEEIVRDTLRPLLQAWLDDHLPGLVERLVREEIARVVGEAGLR